MNPRFFCDECGNYITNDDYTSYLKLNIGGLIFLFCCEDCLWDFIRDNTMEIYFGEEN